jgi:hypothetical protein
MSAPTTEKRSASRTNLCFGSGLVVAVIGPESSRSRIAG